MSFPEADVPSGFYFLRLPPEIRILIYRILLLSLPKRHISLPDTEPFYSTILRTNRQIYSEAISLVYAELTLVLRPDDVLLTSIAGSHQRGPPLIGWRHDPLQGSGIKVADGRHIYDSPELGGYMEPHIFARFQNISFKGTLLTGYGFGVRPSTRRPIVLDERDHSYNIPSSTASDVFTGWGLFPLVICAEDRGWHFNNSNRKPWFTTLATTSSILRDFAQVISSIPRPFPISLTVLIGVNLSAVNVTYTDDLRNAYQKFNINSIANRCVMEFLLNCGILDPFWSLSNVKEFDLDLGLPDFGTMNSLAPPYRLDERYYREIQELKGVIESQSVIGNDESIEN